MRKLYRGRADRPYLTCFPSRNTQRSEGKRTAKPEPPAGATHMSSRPAAARRPAESGREAEHLAGVIYTSSRRVAPRRPAEADGEAGAFAGVIPVPVPRSARWNLPAARRGWADEGKWWTGARWSDWRSRIHGGTDFVAMDCRIRATSPGLGADGDAETEELLAYGEEPRSRSVSAPLNSAPTDRTGREAEDPVGVIYMSSRPVAARRPTEADGEAGAARLGRHTCHPVPQHRAARRRADGEAGAFAEVV